MKGTNKMKIKLKDTCLDDVVILDNNGTNLNETLDIRSITIKTGMRKDKHGVYDPYVMATLEVYTNESEIEIDGRSIKVIRIEKEKKDEK